MANQSIYNAFERLWQHVTLNDSQTLSSAKSYTDTKIAAIPAQTDYSVTITETTTGLASDIAKKYTFTQNGAEIGSINLAKELVVTAGSVKEVTVNGTPYADAKVGDKYIELVIANQDAPIYVPAKDLVDIYTATANATEVQIAISNTNEISATLVNGGVTYDKLDTAVKNKLDQAHTHENKALLDTYTQTEANLADAVSKKHSHTFVESELNKIADGDVAKWNAAEQNAKDYADGLADNYAAADHDHVVADITDFDEKVAGKIEAYGYATTDYADGKASAAQTAAEAKAAELDAALKQELQGEIDADVNVVDDALKAYQKSNDEALAGVKATADAAAVKSEVETALAGKVDKTTYDADKETFATKTDIAKLAGVSEGANKVEKSDTNGNIKIDGVETVVYTHPDKHGIGDVTGLQDALDAKVAQSAYDADKATFATKTALGEVDKKFADYVTAASYATDKAAIDKAIEDEAKARGEADADFETRIAALEDNFGDGEGTVEAQIAAAVAVETKAREDAVAGVQGEVDAVEGRMDTAESKITALETESAKHAIKTEVEAALALKADKSVVDAMYTNAQIDGFIAEAKKHADDNDADTKYGITYDSTNKKIKLVEGGTEAEIDATAFIKDGMIESVVLSEDGLNLVITWNTDADKGENNVTTIPLTGLVDIYTGVEGDRVKVTVSSDKKVSADLVAGSISKNYLDDGVQASLGKADSALQSHQDISHLATKDELKGVDDKFANYTNTTDLNTALDKKADKTQVATDIATAKGEAIADAKTETEKQVKALADGQVKTNTEAIATKANVADVYTKTETYTQEEVNAAIAAAVEAAHTWGTF